ncbi:Reticuline oxidase-like protein [Hibiscus syriacus]|uniref:Reticuline oxidase-like protein n=1 Tax=Hibiscus syriacus TaxID=106335 RepID=A0A6A2ZZF0_HIBSY|nr:berberine bridge enzyme-like 8 [Hibiscus syriacus]KAE8696285.1 Reticuline oxidase-like protein [Hibiscus syriacus]
MGILKAVVVLTMISTLLLSIIWKATLDSDEDGNQNFIQCLLDNSVPSHPISSAIYTPESSSYSPVLQSYIRNLRFNESWTPKPFLILTPLHQSHVQAAVVCGKSHGVRMKIRSGGHDYEGLSYVSDVPFFLLDMFNLRSIDVDIEHESAWVQAGATLGEVFYRIGERSTTHGFPAGVCPTVGVGGHVSGAGYGNMMRKYGVSADNILDAVVVDADGRVLDRRSMGEDLFWAIRGGGGASFAVVVAYKIKLVRVPERVTVFQVEKTLGKDDVTDIVDQWQHVSHNLPEQLFIRLMLDVVKKTVRASFVSLFLGDSDSLISIMNDRFPKLGLTKSDCIELSWVKSILFWSNIPLDTDNKVLLDRTLPTLYHLTRKSDYVREPIPKPGLDSIWKKMIELETPKMYFNPYGGKMAEIVEQEIPFPHRAGNLWKIQYIANWKEQGIEKANFYIDLTRKLHEFMTPFVSNNPRRAFLNYRDADLGTDYHKKGMHEEARAQGIKWFMGNFDRLVKIKGEVDPSNFFRYEQSIPLLPSLQHSDASV